ncbi:MULTISPECIES: hypothetical protein [unclassified Pseudoalteromonas]|uniref:hypothetical protein n=1 Tax=unclassified Pseudoalteromonas TaxID=194690 RepID=UPI000B3C9B5F|nr:MULTISPECIES: hypothetical protein [unclassified Pseudoalteromonas]MDN3380552.1 hypothetical protein [Pseudoalteromonas sp. APC 3893]MDN3388975.1 hypothetical protein [Pseudoalteromonas sp. APC 4017]OUS68807.1 hypothetical protein B5G52_18405 [Pseudoalteromonas sp. A601]
MDDHIKYMYLLLILFSAQNVACDKTLKAELEKGNVDMLPAASFNQRLYMLRAKRVDFMIDDAIVKLKGEVTHIVSDNTH